ncbi:hypothetical protein DPMN_097434 [Dreissena polymorpha]|uniref:Uncharacterized protein n=1 Tax=Dreissena polymorpha TaxID=45954 RepID=A0A9D4LDA0_DREPO|nr:hypothetical protein DPMN_097434 [Dreissena polymorpha]
MLLCLQYPGDKLYIANRDHHDLLTLARDGTLLATFTDPELDWQRGQILVCGGVSNTILQVDREGRNKLATLVTENERLGSPCSVCYSSATSSIIVGRQCDNKILVFRSPRVLGNFVLDSSHSLQTGRVKRWTKKSDTTITKA